MLVHHHDDDGGDTTKRNRENEHRDDTKRRRGEGGGRERGPGREGERERRGRPSLPLFSPLGGENVAQRNRKQQKDREMAKAKSYVGLGGVPSPKGAVTKSAGGEEGEERRRPQHRSETQPHPKGEERAEEEETEERERE